MSKLVCEGYRGAHSRTVKQAEPSEAQRVTPFYH